MIGIAVVGGGETAARHQAAIRQVSGIELRDGAEGLSELLGQENIAVVDVCVPAGQQAEVGIAVARSGKHVVVENFAATSLDEVDRLADACREANVTLTVLQPERRQPLARAVKTAIEDGKLGSLRFAHVSSIWSSQSPVERDERSDTTSMARTGGAFALEEGIGSLDLVRWFFADRPVAQVFARECGLGSTRSASRYASIVLTFADTSQAICEVGRSDAFPAGSGLTRLALTGLRGSAYHEARDGDLLLGPSGTRPLVDDDVEGISLALREWAAAFATGRGLGFDDGRASFGLALAAAESARTGQPVEVRG